MKWDGNRALLNNGFVSVDLWYERLVLLLVELISSLLYGPLLKLHLNEKKKTGFMVYAKDF